MKAIKLLLARVTNKNDDELAQFEQRLLTLGSTAKSSTTSAFSHKVTFCHRGAEPALEAEKTEVQKLTPTPGRFNAFIRSRTS